MASGSPARKAIAQLGRSVAVIDTLPKPTPELYTLREHFGVKTPHVKHDVTAQISLEDSFAQFVAAMRQSHGESKAGGICIDEPLLEGD